MFATKRALAGVGAAAMLATGGVAASASAQEVPVASSAAQGSQSALAGTVTMKATAGYGKASASFKWKGQNRTSGFEVKTTDTNCDGYDAFSFLQFKLKNGDRTWVKTGGQRNWDKSCGNGGRKADSERFITSYKLTHARVVVCKNDKWGSGDTCKKGTWHKNPRA